MRPPWTVSVTYFSDRVMFHVSGQEGYLWWAGRIGQDDKVIKEIPAIVQWLCGDGSTVPLDLVAEIVTKRIPITFKSARAIL